MAVLHGWRAARVTPLGELHAPPRMTAVLVRLAVQVVLVASLWHGLYAHTGTTAGLTEGQAVTYAVLAVLASRLRELDQYAAGTPCSSTCTSAPSSTGICARCRPSATTRCAPWASRCTASRGRSAATWSVSRPGWWTRPGRRPWQGCSR